MFVMMTPNMLLLGLYVSYEQVDFLYQDPYHGPGQAMGLSFSVPEGIKVPSSLINIYKELKQDLECSIPSHGNLERWAVQVKVCSANVIHNNK